MRYKFNQKKILLVIVTLLSFAVARCAGFAKSASNVNIPPSREETRFVTNRTDIEDVVTAKRVVDGDTIILNNGKRLRYIGVNTPEIKNCQKCIESYGTQAAAFNKKLITGKKLRI